MEIKFEVTLYAHNESELVTARQQFLQALENADSEDELSAIHIQEIKTEKGE